MRVLWVWRRLGRCSGCAALAAAMAISVVVGAGAAQAQPGTRLGWRSSAVSWGDNFVGQLGNGTTAGSVAPGGISGLSSGIVQVSAGQQHGLALASDGTVWAWGEGSSGELGNGFLNESTTPVNVVGLSGVTQVSAGTQHSLALRSDGTVWAWGQNLNGELGNGTTYFAQPAPVQVPGLTGVTQIAAGDFFNLALRSDGTVWAWGDNRVGQLGDGSTAADSDVPVQVSGLSRVIMIAAGKGTAMAVTRRSFISTQTTVWTWGWNFYGQIGDGTFTNRLTPVPVAGIGAPVVAGIAEGYGDSLALGSDGSVWAWGADMGGQLNGYPTQAPQPTPAEVAGMGSGITQIAAGDGPTLVLYSDGTVYTWGYNPAGQLGRVQVAGLTNATQVAAGEDFSLAIHLTPPIILR